MVNRHLPIINKLLRVKDDGTRPGRTIIISPGGGPEFVRQGTIFNKYVIRGAKT